MDDGAPTSSIREAGSGLRPILLFFIVAPIIVACVETFLQYSVLAEGDLRVSLGFAILFTVPGTFFAWLVTWLLARLPGAERLPVLAVLALGFIASLLIFRPYNVFIYELVSRSTPRMQALAVSQGYGHVPQSVTRFLLINVSGLFVWIALNLFFMTRFGFPVYGPRGAPETPIGRAAPVRGELPEFCRAAGIADIADLWAISAEEHYLRLHGAFGTRIIRQSFGAAIDQLPKAQGLQVHRSHWVSFGRAARIEAGKTLQIVLADGTKIPVSTSYSKAVRLTEASLLSG
ncbi:MAG: LytTR family transcriptional regulator [Sandarakinorhabdus sp.]|nr:LytTR family transcriptional regulator [Sandarakinorhabdus sp.]